MIADNDFYQFTMSSWAYRYKPDIDVKYKLIVRSQQKLQDRIDPEIFQETFKPLRIDNNISAIVNLIGSGTNYFFRSNYLAALSEAELPDIKCWIENGQFQLSYEGPWWLAMLLETPVLAWLQELWNLGSPTNLGWQRRELNRNLDEKIAWLKKHPYIKFFEFGTRRRHSLEWQSEVLGRLVAELPWGQLLGTSNPYLGQKYGLPPRGTMAHQMFMVDQALCIAENITPQESLKHIMTTWKERYEDTWDGHLLILLTDTFGTEWLLRNLTAEMFEGWHGFRQDSGDPIEWGHRIMKWADKWGIDLKTKMLAFSDALTIEKMDEIYTEFAGKADVAFGWGTNLTNDGSVAPISMVIKPYECKGLLSPGWLPCIKLSDNLAKATGSKPVIEYYKDLFGYKNDFSEAPIY